MIYFIFLFSFQSCYASTQRIGDISTDDSYAGEDFDDRLDVPDDRGRDIPFDDYCEQMVCVDCECLCPDGTTMPWGGCYSVCESIPECPHYCPPGYCPSCTESPGCPTAPADGPVGMPCTSHEDCELGSECFYEDVQYFNSETYVNWPGGYCSLYGSGNEGCDPEIPETCPEGSKCIYLGEYFNREWYGCFDSCSVADEDGIPYDWACGCRRGYQCNINSEICLPGCSNDRECCEFWNDLNQDGLREESEVILFEDCTGWCDNEWNSECKASYSCKYPGNPNAKVGDSCQHDYQCMQSGTCLSSLYTDPITGNPYYPGGYCTIFECTLKGRECSPSGGVCANFSGTNYRNYMCVTPCDVGTSPQTPGYKCRATPLEEAQACFPAWPGMFVEEPPQGEDGFCWFGNFGNGNKEIGESCNDDSECASHLGLGSCFDWFGRIGFCTASCNQKLVNENRICGGIGGDGIAEGVCAWGYCWEGCNNPDSPPGENGCRDNRFACAPLYILGAETFVPEGSTRPLGVCMPPCASDSWCAEYFGSSRRCDTVTRACR